MSSSLEKAIPPIVEFALPRFSNRNLGLLLKIEIEIEYVGKIFKNKKQPKLKYLFWTLFQRPSNYTRVFTRIFNTEDLGRKEHFQDIVGMNRTSDHDSCWRSDGLREIWKLYTQTADRFEEKYNRKVIPIRDLHFDWSFYLLDGIKYVWVEYQEPYHHDKTTYNFRFEKVKEQIINT